MPLLVTRFLRWTFLRAAFARGWWLVTAVYLVVEARLSPFQLVFIGIAQGIVVVIAEVPAGVLADTVSRRLSLVVAHVCSGAGMLLTGLVTSFPLLVLTNCLWGLGWAFASGADVAWLTDELRRPTLIDRVLARRGWFDLLGAGAGLLVFGALASATDLDVAIVAAGAGMVALGAVVVARFPETGFVPATGRRRTHAAAVFRSGVALARRDREIRAVLLAVLLINGAAEGYGRLFETRLLGLGFASGDHDPIVWFTGLGLVCMGIGVVTLRMVERRINGAGVARRVYATTCIVSALGMFAFAHAPDASLAVAGAIFVGGLAGPIARPVADIWVNRRTTSEVRATVHSFSSQAENLGEIVFGFGLAVVAGVASVTLAISGSVLLTLLAGIVVIQAREARPVVSVGRT